MPDLHGTAGCGPGRCRRTERSLFARVREDPGCSAWRM